MKCLSAMLLFVIELSAPAVVVFSQSFSYPWLEAYEPSENILNRIPVPHDYKRIETSSGSFEDWLRHLPLKSGAPPVYLYDGREKLYQGAHFAVIDIDVGERDLQQCADAAIRLRAEYLNSKGLRNAINFQLTNGHLAEYSKWIEGYRPVVTGDSVRWIQSAESCTSYASFRTYLNSVFMYAGTYSLSQELQTVHDVNQMRIGDLFIEGGFPGHAVLVVDMAEHQRTGQRLFLLAQSYMPAQDIHILKNPLNSDLSPWYELDFGETLYTPEWTFSKKDLMRF